MAMCAKRPHLLRGGHSYLFPNFSVSHFATAHSCFCHAFNRCLYHSFFRSSLWRYWCSHFPRYHSPRRGNFHLLHSQTVWVLLVRPLSFLIKDRAYIHVYSSDSAGMLPPSHPMGRYKLPDWAISRIKSLRCLDLPFGSVRRYCWRPSFLPYFIPPIVLFVIERLVLWPNGRYFIAS